MEQAKMCPHCDGPMSPHVERIGSREYVDDTHEAPECRACGYGSERSLDALASFERRAALQALRDDAQFTTAEDSRAVLRYARGALGFSRDDMARWLGMSSELLHALERGDAAATAEERERMCVVLEIAEEATMRVEQMKDIGWISVSRERK